MLRFTYEGEKYSTEEYRLSECKFFYFVPADLVSSTLASVMEELIIPIEDCYDSKSPMIDQEQVDEMAEDSRRLLQQYENVGERIRQLDQELRQNQEQLERLRLFFEEEEPEVQDCWEKLEEFIFLLFRKLFRS